MSGDTFGFLLGAIVFGPFPVPAISAEAEAWLYKWQTLLSGGLALLAAIVTIVVIVGQIQQTGTIETNRRRRKLRAARATLPMALAAVCDYAEGCVRDLISLMPVDEERVVARLPARPELPADIIPTFEKCIEFADEPEASHLIGLLRRLQIQYSRLADAGEMREDRLLLRLNIETYIVDGAEVHFRASSLFAFSRETDQHPAHSLMNSLGNMGIHDFDERLRASIEARQRQLDAELT
jgi:hypothetical protein